MSEGQNGSRLRRFGWKASLLAAVVVAMVWLVVAQRTRIAESLGLLAHANWWWVGAAVVAQAVSMGAMARQQRRLLGVGGSRISLAGVVATTYAGNAISVGLPLAGPAAATLFAMRRFVDLGAEASVAGWALAVSGVFSSFALVAVVALGAVVSGSGLAVVSAAVGVLGGAVPLAVLLLSLRRPGPRRLLEKLGTRLVAGVQKVSGKPEGDPEEIVQEQLEEVTALDPDRPTLWIAALLAALNWLADVACLAFAILAVGGDVPWEGLLLAWAAGTAVASLGLTPGGLGVVEAALSSALIATGLVGSTAIAAVLVYRIVSLWLVLAAGGLTLLGLGGPKLDLSGTRPTTGPIRPAQAEGPRRSAAGRPPRGRRQQAPVADGQQPGQLVHDHRIAADQHARAPAVHGAQDDLGGVGRVQGQQLVEPVAAQLPLRGREPGADDGVARDVRPYPARVHAGHPDTHRRQLPAQRLGEPADGELARAVCRLARRREDPEDAGQRDEVRAGVCGEHRQQRAGHRDDRLEVHRDHRIELGRVHLVEPAGERDPGIVDQQRGLRMGRGDRRSRSDGRRGVREVGDVVGIRTPVGTARAAAATAARPSASRSSSTRLLPRAASPAASAAPIPLAAPVTTAVPPSNS